MKNGYEIEEKLINNPRVFQKESMEKRAKEMDFTQAWVLEVLAWNFEIYGQLQKISGQKFILKGGTATQLFINLDDQRASIDLDILSLASPQETHKILKKIEEKFCPHAPYFTFNPHRPKKPEIPLPMETFFVLVPMTTGQSSLVSGEYPGYQIKIDILYLSGIPAKITLPGKTETLALDLSYRPHCLSPGALFADKILTFALGSIGVPIEREIDLQKHFYDLSNLSCLNIDEKMVKDILETIEFLIPREASFRKIKVTTDKVIKQIEGTLERFSKIDLREGERKLKDNLRDFQSLYVRREKYKRPYMVATEALRLGFIIKCLRKYFAGEGVTISELIARGNRGEKKLTSVRVPQKKREISLTLLKILEDTTRQRWKELKGAPPQRIYWQIISPENITKIEPLFDKM